MVIKKIKPSCNKKTVLYVTIDSRYG